MQNKRFVTLIQWSTTCVFIIEKFHYNELLENHQKFHKIIRYRMHAELHSSMVQTTLSAVSVVKHWVSSDFLYQVVQSR